jgi:hypothetical protein
VPLIVSIRVGQPTLAIGPVSSSAVAVAVSEPLVEKISIDPDYENREGYDPEFLGPGRLAPLPHLGKRRAADAARLIRREPGASPVELKYHHFSVVVNRRRRLSFFTVFTGPVFRDDDPAYRGVQIPRRFWKVTAVVRPNGELGTLDFHVEQTSLLGPVLGEATAAPVAETDGPDGRASDTLVERVKSGGPTDVMIFSHGWQGDVSGARSQYAHWLGTMASCRADRTRADSVRPGFQHEELGHAVWSAILSDTAGGCAALPMIPRPGGVPSARHP